MFFSFLPQKNIKNIVHPGSTKRVVLLQGHLMLTQDEKLFLAVKRSQDIILFLNIKGIYLWHLRDAPSFLILSCYNL